MFNGKLVPLHPLKWRRSLRLSVRTRDFHSLKRSSTLLGTTIKSVICTASATDCIRNGDGGFPQGDPPRAAIAAQDP